MTLRINTFLFVATFVVACGLGFHTAYSQINDSQLLCSEHYDTSWWKSLREEDSTDFQSYQRRQQGYMQGLQNRYEAQVFDCICNFHVDYYNSATAEGQSAQEREAFFLADRGLLRQADTCIEAEFSLTVNTTTIDEDSEDSAVVTVSTGGAAFLTDQTITLSLDGTATRGTDYNVRGTDYNVSKRELTLREGQTSVIARVTAVNDTEDDDGETIVIAAHHAGEMVGETRTITIIDDDETVVVTLVLTPDVIGENDEVSTVTATLDRASSSATTVTVTAEAVFPAVAGDFTQSGSILTIPAGGTASTGVVTITAVDNGVDTPDKSVTVTGTARNDLGVEQPDARMLTIRDDDGTPIVTLVLAPASIEEDGGVSMVTATLDRASSSATTVTVTAGAVSPAVAGDFTLSGNTLTIAAGATTSTGEVTITAVDNDVDAPDKEVRVSAAAASNSQGVTGPADEALTIRDDDGTPIVTLVLAPASIEEDGGVSMVTATLDRASSSATTVTVTAGAVSPAVAGDFTLSGNTLTIAAGATTSTGEVTITAVDNDVDAPDKEVRVSAAAASNSQGVTGPADEALTIRDDDGTPIVTLVLAPASIEEDGGVSMVTATLDRASSSATTVTVTAGAVSPAVAGDFTLSGNTLTIAAGATTSTGEVTITAVDNDVDAPDKEVRVSAAAASNSQGVTGPADEALTIRDDDGTPIVTLVLAPASIEEDGGVSMVTATLDRASSSATTVTVTAGAVSPAVAGDFTLSGNTLTIAAGATTSTGEVTITAVDNDVDAPDKEVRVSAAAASNSQGVTGPADEALTIRDDDGTPIVTLVLAPASIEEDGGVSMVTATLDRASSSATTVTVTAGAVSPAVAGDFTLSGNTLTIAAGATTSTGEVTITAVDNDVDAPDKEVRVSAAAASNSQGVTGPADEALTIRDDDGTPMVTLVLAPASIEEDGGVSMVTATLDRASSSATTVTVTAGAVSPAVAGDFTLSGNTLTIAAGATTSTGEVTITAVDNDVDAPDKEVRVSAAAASNSQGVTGPADEALTIRDDDGTPMVTLVLAPASIEEDGGVSMVTATLDRASSSATTVTVTAGAVSPAVAGDFTLSGNTLTIAAGATTSTGEVTITAVDNDVDAPDKSVTVAGTATNELGIEQPDARTLTITDDDGAGVEVTETTLTMPEGGNGSYELSLTSEPEGAVAVTVVSDDPGAVTVSPDSLAFNSENWDDPQTVTVTAEDDVIPDDGKTVVLRHEVAGYGSVTVAHVTVSVMSDLRDSKEVVEQTLEAVVTSTLSNVTTNIGTRFSAARGGTAVTLAGRPISLEESALAFAAFNDHSDSGLHGGYSDERWERDLSLTKLLETSAFQVSLSAADEDAQGVGPVQSLTVWGRVDRMFFDKESGDFNRYDGDLKAGYLGIDTWLDDRWLIGIAASITKVDADYGLDIGGDLDLSMVGVHPYLRLALDDVSELWLILGVSKGKIRNLSTAAGSTPEDSDIMMYMSAAGVRRELATIGGIDIALLGDAGFGSLRSGGRSGLQAIDNLSADSWRARLGFSGSHTIQLEGLATFTPFVEIVGRYDGGGNDDVGVELAGGIQYANPASGLGLEMRANVLPLYSESDYREYGFSISASASPGVGGEGLAMAVSTSLGPEIGRPEALLRGDLFGPVDASKNLAEALSLNAEIGYGFPLVGSKGVLTPFGGFRLSDGGGQQMRAGMRFGRMAYTKSWNLELSGEQRRSDTTDPEYLVSLLGRLQF